MPDGGVPFVEAQEYLRQKIRLPSRAWTDLREGANARSFVVAGANSDALVADFHASIQRMLDDGLTLADFRRDFDAIVAKHGWTYKGGRTWRTRVIFDTNLRVARAAGRWAQIERQAEREARLGRVLYLRYVAVLDDRTRPEHRGWHGLVLPWDHPWWASHYPPNGWYCRCTIQVLTERDLKRFGFTPTPADKVPAVEMEARSVTLADGSKEIWETPAGIETGFGHNAGRSWLSGAVPRELQEPLPPAPAPLPRPEDLPPLPPPRPVAPEKILPDDLAPEDYAAAFLGEFGATVEQGALFRDAAGHAVGIDADLFRRRDGTWKVDSQGRHRFLLVLAEALKDPDEIWIDWAEDHEGRPILRRRYLTALTLPKLSKDEKGTGLYAAVEWTAAGWRGVTLFQSRTAPYLDRQRTGVLLYRR
ncbi:MAG: minor capsid protein [Caenispirillum sp.]|nr:minor capsid protein [Caenispirillum sp.]